MFTVSLFTLEFKLYVGRDFYLFIDSCSLRKSKAAPDIQELAQHSQLRTGALYNMNNFAEEQHQTRPLCDLDISRQKHSVITFEHRQNINIVQITIMTNIYILADLGDYCLLTNDMLASWIRFTNMLSHKITPIC